MHIEQDWLICINIEMKSCIFKATFIILLRLTLQKSQKGGGIMREKLFRSRKDRVIGGICGGLAEYFGIDPIIIRIIFVVLVIGKGVGVLAYIILWVVLPEEPIEHYYARFNQGTGANAGSDTGNESKPQDTTPGTEAGNQTQSTDYDFYKPQKRGGSLFFGMALILIGAIFLFWTIIPSFDLDIFFPLLLVILGAVLIFNSLKK